MTLNRALCLALLLLGCSAAQADTSEPPATSGTDARGVVVTMAPNRPPCPNAYAVSEQNCYGTRATTHSFPMLLDERLWFPQQPSSRVSWIFVGPVVAPPTDLARALWLEIASSGDGHYVLSAGVDGQTTIATAATGTWTPVQIPLEQRFWVRVEPTQIGPE